MDFSFLDASNLRKGRPAAHRLASIVQHASNALLEGKFRTPVQLVGDAFDRGDPSTGIGEAFAIGLLVGDFDDRRLALRTVADQLGKVEDAVFEGAADVIGSIERFGPRAGTKGGFDRFFDEGEAASLRSVPVHGDILTAQRLAAEFCD